MLLGGIILAASGVKLPLGGPRMRVDQDVVGEAEVAGGGCDDGLRADEDFLAFVDGDADFRLADKRSDRNFWRRRFARGSGGSCRVSRFAGTRRYRSRSRGRRLRGRGTEHAGGNFGGHF